MLTADNVNIQLTLWRCEQTLTHLLQSYPVTQTTSCLPPSCDFQFQCKKRHHFVYEITHYQPRKSPFKARPLKEPKPRWTKKAFCINVSSNVRGGDRCVTCTRQAVPRTVHIKLARKNIKESGWSSGRLVGGAYFFAISMHNLLRAPTPAPGTTV